MANVEIRYEIDHGEVIAKVKICPGEGISEDMKKFLDSDTRESVGKKFEYNCFSFWLCQKRHYGFKKVYTSPACCWNNVRKVIKKDARALLLHLGSILGDRMPLTLPPEKEEFEIENPIYREAEEE